MQEQLQVLKELQELDQERRTLAQQRQGLVAETAQLCGEVERIQAMVDSLAATIAGRQDERGALRGRAVAAAVVVSANHRHREAFPRRAAAPHKGSEERRPTGAAARSVAGCHRYGRVAIPRFGKPMRSRHGEALSGGISCLELRYVRRGPG